MLSEAENNNYRMAVPSEFGAVFSHFYYAENKTLSSITKTLLPSFQTILVFSFGTKVVIQSQQKTILEIEKCMVLGPIKQAFDYTLPPDSQILVVNFKEDAFYRFFGNALLTHSLPIHPDALIPENCFTILWGELKKISETKDRVYFLLDFCKPYLRDQNRLTQLLTNFKDDALDPIKAIAASTQQSERNIQLHQKKFFGYSIKELNRYERFLKATEQIQKNIINGSKTDWLAIVNQCGFYDQSQLIHDFKYYMNISPTKFLKFQKDICVAKGF
ncbi:AraC family transcriptional regulator [Flavobacterium sp. Fl-77]|uniref:AraC family transcriptional regulator n=1 Tax=Flavobacterium flavipigmentatum TaxID=2893884 RepID=A0AAJ2VY38_9FLAO|nr:MULTISPECIES: AraC family transcriptional regulator [unclassified Flavobacterium]MDX6183093.1 AraC family transcriptional regulator [Flavobacterium sp. Fl-33]MDX6186838.1 AraC family transcriptional regulator [Flavobacterium sp. Fl-77]UFH40491.1 AraC family transcriptional regulator [Flavobacterium sp. F-70]